MQIHKDRQYCKAPATENNWDNHKTNRIREIKKQPITNPCSKLNNDLSTCNLQMEIPLNSNSDNYFNGINTLGGNLIVKPDMIAYSDGSMIIKEKINYSFASAVFLNKGSPTKLSIALQHDRHSLYRAELWCAILACISVPNNIYLLVFLDCQGVLKSYCSRLDLKQSPRRKLGAQCCVDWALLRLVLNKKGVKLTLRWVKGHSTCKGNNLADKTANYTCNAMKLGMCNPSVMNKRIYTMIDIKPL
jgi:ribonuclease HI